MFWTVALGAPIGVVVLVAGCLAAWRMIPRSPTAIGVSERLADLDARIEALRAIVLDFGDKYETAVARGKGRKRRKEEGDDAPPEVAPAAPVVALPLKDELRARAGLVG